MPVSDNGTHLSLPCQPIFLHDPAAARRIEEKLDRLLSALAPRAASSRTLADCAVDGLPALKDMTAKRMAAKRKNLRRGS